MPSWPDPAWYDAVHGAAGAAAVTGEPFDARVRVVVGSPGGDVVEHWVVRGGRLVAGGPGDPGDAEVVCSIDASDLALVHGRALDPAVAFMQGRLKVAGDPGQVVALVSLAHALVATGAPG